MLAGDLQPLPDRPGRQHYRADFGSDRTGRLLQKVFGRDDDDDDAGKCRRPPAPPA